MSSLIDILRASVPLLPEAFRTEHQALFTDENLKKLMARLLLLFDQGDQERPPPHFAAEVTPPLRPILAWFIGPLELWELGREAPILFADAMANAGCANLLLLLGQRRTPASITDARGIPPTCEQLLAAANKLHADGDKLTVAGRALTKHVHRSPEAFWGEVTGSAEEKNAAALKVLNRILDNPTWWNVFGHFQHE